jgi:hypothetical protein
VRRFNKQSNYVASHGHTSQRGQKAMLRFLATRNTGARLARYNAHPRHLRVKIKEREACASALLITCTPSPLPTCRCLHAPLQAYVFFNSIEEARKVCAKDKVGHQRQHAWLY